MKILAIEKDVPGVTLDKFKPHLKAEARKVWELSQSGVLREYYFRADQSNAVLMLECDSIEKAQSILDSLPLVKEKLIRFEIIPLKPYPGFARLFAEETG